jgi:hypothetical protein
MKKTSLGIVSFVIMFFLFVENSFGQQQTANLSKLNDFIQEVYQNCPQYQDSLRIQMGTDYLQRTIIHTVSLDQYPECPLLSSVSKKDKCNPEMDYSLENFSPDTFNPLKYHFQYYSPTPTYFRVDGKEYIIEIKPKN